MTTIFATVLFAALGWWALLGAYGAAMFVGAVYPPANILDYWISFVARTRHRTVLHPKRFALGMGGAMLVAAGAFGASGHVGAAWTFALLTVGAAGLLAAFKFCLGCWIYAALVAPWAERRARTAS